MYGHSDIARLLLAKGAFLEHADAGDRTAFTMLWFQRSRCFSRVEFLRLLLAYSPIPAFCELTGPASPLACAAMRGSVDDLELLLSSELYAGKNVVVNDSIIRYSIIGSNMATFDFLLPLMPNHWVFEVNSRGQGPLHWALEYPTEAAGEVVKRLLSAGANAFLKDDDGNDPWDLARISDEKAKECDCAYRRNLQACFNVLLTRGFDVELDEEGDLWWPCEDCTAKEIF